MRNHCYFLFLRVLRCFSSPGSPNASWRCARITPGGFPHSDIRGSQGICPSPRLFAACHVLHRLREPQASPMRPFCLSLVLHGEHLPRTGAASPSCLIDLLSSCRSIALSTRFLRFDFKTLARLRPPVRRTGALLFLYSSRSQHVNDLISLFSVVPGRLELPTSTLSV